MKKNRTKEIAAYVNQHGYVSTPDLCAAFEVSTATMRRDLIALQEAGSIRRVRGGAQAVQATPENDHPLVKRVGYQPEEKAAIALRALDYFDDGASIILDCSTTCLALARAIKEHGRRATVITNYFAIAQELAEEPAVEMLFIGGYVKKGYFSTGGSVSEQAMRAVKADVSFLGFDGIDPVRGISNNQLDAIAIKQIIIENSGFRVGLADHTKFGASALMNIAPLSALDVVITDNGLAIEETECYLQAGLKVDVAR